MASPPRFSAPRSSFSPSGRPSWFLAAFLASRALIFLSEAPSWLLGPPSFFRERHLSSGAVILGFGAVSSFRSAHLSSRGRVLAFRTAIFARRAPGASRKADILFRVADPYEQEVRRLAELIGSLVELSGRPVEAVAAAAGLEPEDLAGIFRGTAKLELTHLLRLSIALGVHPGEFFYLAHPRRVPSGGSTRELLERARAALRAGSGAEAATPDGPENDGPSGADPASEPAGGRPRGGSKRP
jgi:hypothetical protein